MRRTVSSTPIRAAAGVACDRGGCMKNRVFFPQAALDQWIVDGTVELQEGELSITSEGKRYRLAEAVRVLGEVSGAGDGHDLVGRVKARLYLEQLGAEIIQGSMLLGESAYDVEPGWLGIPMGLPVDGAKCRVSRQKGMIGGWS